MKVSDIFPQELNPFNSLILTFRNTSLANDSVVNELNDDSTMSNPNPNCDQNTSQNISDTEQLLLEDQGAVNELSRDFENPEDQTNLVQNQTNDDVLDFMVRYFPVIKTDTQETKESEPKEESVYQEECKEDLNLKEVPLETKESEPKEESVHQEECKEVLQQRPNFEDLPIASSFLSVRHKKGLREIMSDRELSKETKIAQKNERKREMLIKSKKEMMENLNNCGSSLDLDYDTETKEFVTVHSQIVGQMKQHQVDGVKFMYDSCFVGVDHIETFPGSGCILAHCMGLGKTLQVHFFFFRSFFRFLSNFMVQEIFSKKAFFCML